MKIVLINMPFADANRPSLSLTQLRSRIVDRFDCELLYLNQDATDYFGHSLYRSITQEYMKGLGDWLFRQIAFPEQADNTEAYFMRHYPYQDPQSQALKKTLLQKRKGLRVFLQEMIQGYQIHRADLVGFSSMFTQNVACFAMSRLLKERNPNLYTAIGGANCETPMGEEIINQVASLDFVFSGPALVSFPSLLDKLQTGDGYQQIKGVFTRQNQPFQLAGMSVGKELSIEEPLTLDYRSFLKGFDQRFPEHCHEKELPFETSRGCWWGERSHCTFCGLNSSTMNYRAMSPKTARAKLEEVLAYSTECDHFTCVDNIMPGNFVNEVLAHVDVPKNVDIFYEVRANLEGSTLQQMAAKGIKRVQPGIEVLSTTTLKLMKKGTTAFGNLIFLQNCVRFQVDPQWNLLVGFPGELETVYQKYVQDIPLLSHLPPPSGCYPVRFDRYSPYFKQPEAFNLDLKPYDFYRDIYPFSDLSLAKLAYFFQDHNLQAAYSRQMLRYIGQLHELVQAWRNYWHNQETPPRLYCLGERMVYDSRFEKSVKYRLQPEEFCLLGALEKPKAALTLVNECTHLSSIQVQSVLASLQEKKLLFVEGNRYLSLLSLNESPFAF